MSILLKSNFEDLNLIRRGKVRDIYEVDEKLLIVASDRMSAFDVVMDDPIPDKGKILTQLSLFWFKHFEDIVENHVISTNPSDYPESCRKYQDQLKGRSMLVKKTKVLPIECIVRSYITGSGCKEYKKQHGKEYWTKGDYNLLDEATKEFDRNIARWYLNKILKYKLNKEKTANENVCECGE